MAERKVFWFLRSYYEAAQELSKEDQADFFMAVCSYALDGVEPEIHGVASALFKLAKPNLDTSVKKAEAGAKGGKNGSKSEANSEQEASNEEAEDKQNEVSNKQAESKPQADNKQSASKDEANIKQTEAPLMNNDLMSNEKMNNEKGIMKNEKMKREDEENGFAIFWEHYPRHDSKQEARKAYSKALKKGVGLDMLISAIEKQKQSQQWQESGGKYIPYPATWLNQERWDDEVNLKIPKGRNDVQAGYEQAMMLLGGEDSG